MLPVSLDCQFLITPSFCVPYVASFSGLSVFDYPFVLCTLCYKFIWIVSFWLPLRLVYPMLPVSLDCQFWLPLRLVASFSEFSVSDYPFVLCILCCQFPWIVRSWLPLRLVYPMLPVSLDFPFLITPSSCVPYVASLSGLSVFIKNGQSRETGNIGYTRRRGNQKLTIQRNWLHRVHKTKG
jgi:hypothetical protein